MLPNANTIRLALRMLCKECYRIFIVLAFHVDGGKRFKNVTCELV